MASSAYEIWKKCLVPATAHPLVDAALSCGRRIFFSERRREAALWTEMPEVSGLLLHPGQEAEGCCHFRMTLRDSPGPGGNGIASPFWNRFGRVGSWELEFKNEQDKEPGPLRWSDEVYRIAGLEPATIELNTSVFFSLVPLEEREPIRTAVLEAVRTRSEYSFAHRIIRPDGETRLVRETGRVYEAQPGGPALRLIGTAHDITEQYQAEEAVLTQAQILDQIGQAVVATDLSRIITYANRAAEALYGWSTAEMIGKNIVEIAVPPESRANVQDRLSTADPGESWTGEFRSWNRNGRVLYVSVTESPLRDSAGRLVGRIGIATDITERKLAEEQIKTLSSAIEQAEDSVVITDPTGVVHYVNSAFERTTGYTAAEVIGGKTSILKSGHHPPEFYENLWNTILAGEPFKAEFTNRRKNGELLYEEKCITPLRASDGRLTHFVAVGRDIGNKRASEIALRTSEERYRLLFESNPHPMWVFDRETLRFLAVNGAAIAHYGYSREEFLGMTIRDIRPPEEIPNLLKDLEEVGNERRSGVWRHRLKSGREIQVQASAHSLTFGGRPARMILAVDITERLRAQQELRESEERFRQLADNIAEVFWVMDVAPRRVLYVSPAYEKIWGRSPETLYNSQFHWSDAIHPEDRESALAAAQQTELSGRSEATYRIIRPDGTIRWIRDKGYEVRDAEGRVYRLVGTAEDITTEKREEERSRTFSRLAQLLNTATSARDAAQIIIDAAFQLIGCDFAALDLCSPASPTLTRILAVERSVQKSSALAKCAFRDIIPSDTAREIFSTGAKLVSHEEGSIAVGCSSCCRESALTSTVLLVPVRDGTRDLGILLLQTARSNAYVSGDLEVLTSLADHCGGALNRIYTHALQQASEMKVQRLFESDVLGVLTWNSEGQISDANNAFLKLIGYSREDLAEGRVDWRRLTPSDLIHLDYQGLEEIKRTGRCTPFEKEYIHKEGRRIPVLVGATSLEDNADLGICFVLDISERKSAEQKLRESEERFRLLSEASNQAIWDLHLQDGSVWWNHGFKTLFGLDPNKPGSVPLFAQKVHPADRNAILSGLEAAIASGANTWSGDYRIERADGSYGWVEDHAHIIRDENGHPVRVIGGIIDVTERRLAQERITEQAALLDHAHEAILVKDLDHTIIYWNKGAEQIYGWTAREALGQKVQSLLGIDPGVYAMANESLQQKGKWSGELTAHARDRGVLTIEVHWTLVRHPDGTPKSILGINVDLTEKKKLEAQFLRAQRMESIGTLAGGIAHDLNNVLAPILMSVELLQDAIPDDDNRAILSTIASSAQRGADLVRQVLSFAKGIGGKRVTVNLLHLARDIQKIARDTFPKNITFRLQFSRDLWTVAGDPTHLHQVLMNLCVNARDAMSLGGRLDVELTNTRLDEVYAGLHPESKSGDFVVMSVSDTGTGIPAAIREKIFDPFFTTKEPGHGTGLGLATVATLVKEHGGFVNLYSEVGRGTTFKVYIPAIADAVESRATQPENSDLPRGNSELLLVIDDEEAVRSIARKTLESFGYRVLVASNGAEAISQYAQRPSEIALVLTDMAMPVMDGTSTIIALRSLNPKVRVVGSSGLSANHEIARTLGAGLEYFLPKPYTAETLVRTVRLALNEGHRGGN